MGFENRLTVKDQEYSEQKTATLPRNLNISIFKETSLINRLTILFEESDPNLSMMSTIWKLMCLTAAVRRADRQHLLLSMGIYPENENFLKALAKCLIRHKITCHRMCYTPEPGKPHLDSIFGVEDLPPFKCFWNKYCESYCLNSHSDSPLNPILSIQVQNFLNAFFCYLSHCR